MHDHLGERDLGRADRVLERPLEVDDAEQLPAVDDRGRDLAADVVTCRAIVGIGEDVGHELGLLRLGGPRPAPNSASVLTSAGPAPIAATRTTSGPSPRRTTDIGPMRSAIRVQASSDTPIATGVATSRMLSNSAVERIERSPEQAEKDHRAEGDRGPAQLDGAAFAQPERAQQAARQGRDTTVLAQLKGRVDESSSDTPARGGHHAHRDHRDRWGAVTRPGYPEDPFDCPSRRARRPSTGLRYTPRRYPTCILVMHRAQRCTLSSGSSRIAGDRPVPHIVTELPGPKARAHVEFDETWTSPSLPRAYPIVPVRGDGLVVEDIDGNLFLDFAAGIAVNSTGHSHPQVVAAIKEQASELIHFSASDFYLPIYPEVCRELARIAPISGRVRAYLGNSGTEVVEASIKLARFATKRPYIVAFLGAFHGRTYGSVSLTASKAKYHAGFGPLLPGIFHAPYGRVEDLKWFDDVLFDKLAPADEVAAIIVEPIQGEGGYIVPEDGFLQGLRDICDKHGILLIADEIQSGAGRTGKMWAVDHWGVEPDILLTAKGIASGMTLGAMVARADLLETWGPGAHGSTYGGNPVACAAALATIELLEGGLVANAATRGEQAQAGLRPLIGRFDGLVRDVRGKGLMLGIEFDTAEHAEEVQWACFEAGLLVLECGKSSVRMSPALTVSEAEMETALRIFGEAVAAVADHGPAVLAEVAEAGALHGVESAG